MGVWIETTTVQIGSVFTVSHPAWVCGLKHVDQFVKKPVAGVTPCVGVWIETRKAGKFIRRRLGHTLRGCVD